jgi:hypothetical protein
MGRRSPPLVSAHPFNVPRYGQVSAAQSYSSALPTRPEPTCGSCGSLCFILRVLPLASQPLEPLDFIGYSACLICGVTPGRVHELIPARAQRPRAQRGPAGHRYQAVLFIVSGYAAGGRPILNPVRRSHPKGPVGALSLTLLNVTSYRMGGSAAASANGYHRSDSRTVVIPMLD